MTTRSATRLFAAIALSVSLAVTACGAEPAADSGQTSGNTKSQSPSEPPVEFAQVDSGLVRGLVPTTYTDDSRGVRAEVPIVATARQLTSAMEVLRERGLREAAWDKATKVDIGYRVVASGPGTLGVIVTPTWSGAAGETSKPALVWYDAGTKKVYSSPVLIREDQWPAFKAEVAKAAGKNKKLDQARLGQALDAEAAPQGNGPMLGFDGQGDMVVRFAAKMVSDQSVSLRVPAAAVQPLLSEFGQRAAAASQAPSAFDGTPAPQSSAGSATPGPAATPGAASTPGTPGTAGASGASAAPGAAASPATTPGVKRPSTAVGPDCSKVTCVALTYDDGPGADTPELLESLLAAKAPATFFQLGNMIKANPKIAKQVASDGNEVGSHSVTHPNLAGLSGDRLSREVAGNADIMEQAYGRKPMIMRPPYGSHNKAVDEAVRGTGAAIIQWDTDTNDWKTKNTAATETSAIAGGKANTIILMHDIHPSTVAAAPAILEGLKKKGVTLVTVSELSLNSGGYGAGRAYCNGTAAGKQNGFNCAG